MDLDEFGADQVARRSAGSTSQHAAVDAAPRETSAR
jgi:hypothetical protein